MKIGEHLREKRISLNLKSRDKEQVVKELALLLKDAPEVSDFDAFVKDIFERESLNSTGIGQGLALPHARTDAVKSFVIAFGRSPEGVDFDSLDGRPAKLVFLMGTPKEKNLKGYLEALARISRLLQRESFRKALLQALSPKQIIEEFNKIEK